MSCTVHSKAQHLSTYGETMSAKLHAAEDAVQLCELYAAEDAVQLCVHIPFNAEVSA
jgi:hypothetical protein